MQRSKRNRMYISGAHSLALDHFSFKDVFHDDSNTAPSKFMLCFQFVLAFSRSSFLLAFLAPSINLSNLIITQDNSFMFGVPDVSDTLYQT